MDAARKIIALRKTLGSRDVTGLMVRLATRASTMPRLVVGLLYLLLVSGLARSGEIPLREVVDILFKAPPAGHPDFAGKDLSSLDLSGLDFKQARLTGANLLGADLSDANLSKVNLSGASSTARVYHEPISAEPILLARASSTRSAR
jgi:hypothetical protein